MEWQHTNQNNNFALGIYTLHVLMQKVIRYTFLGVPFTFHYLLIIDPVHAFFVQFIQFFHQSKIIEVKCFLTIKGRQCM